MAHVKVVRRSMDKSEWIEIRTKWLRDRIVEEALPVTGWKIREARQVEEMTYEFTGEERPILKGEEYFFPDGTVFLSADAAIPEAWAGKPVWFSFETAAEMMVKVNGKWTGGVDPNRQRVALRKAGEDVASLKIEMEGYNRSKPDDERNPETAALRGCRQIFPGGEILILDELVKDAYYDAKILNETIHSEYVEEDVRNSITGELHKALLYVDFDSTDRELLRDGLRSFRRHLDETVFNGKNSYHIGKVALVAHSHLDLAYYWRRIHTVQKNARTCLIQLDLMDQYDDFTYAHTQAYTYETLEKYYPEIFERVRKRVEEGRFELVGGMYVEPDCNVPTAESLVRQSLYGQQYFREKFNRTVNNCWLPDVFGNTWILPQILRKSGMDYFVSNKMSTWNDTNLFPHNNFIWRGIDGSDILACVPPTHFISWNTPDQIIENWSAFQEKDVCPETLNMFGYGDGGSGVTEEMLEFKERLNKIPSLPEVRHVRGDAFLGESIHRDQALEEWDGELYLEMHRGTFTTKGYLKMMNRRFEILLREAEYLLTLVYAKTGEYPREELDSLWKLLLINQFHDILPGTHIAPVERDTRKDYDAIGKKLNSLIEKALDSLASGGTSLSEASEGDSLLLINTLGWNRSEPCFIKGLTEKPAGVSCQEGTLKGEKGLWILPGDISPFASLTLPLETNTQPRNGETDWFTYGSGVLETPYYRAKLEDSGTISELYSKEYGKSVQSRGGFLGDVKVYHDYPGMYDAWDILDNYKDKEEELLIESPLALSESGSLYFTLESRLVIGNSRITRTIRFYRNSPIIDMDFHADWQERNRLVKLEFDMNVLARQAGCDTSAGTIFRDTHRNTSWQKARFEVCMHKYVDLSETGFGVALLNDSKYGVSLHKNQVGVSLLRGSIRPDNNSDKGSHRFSVSLYPHGRNLEESDVIERAWNKNVPLLSKQGRNSGLGETGFVEAEHLHLQSLKKAQNDDGIICRFVELHGKRGTADLNFRLPVKDLTLTNLLEDGIEDEAGILVPVDGTHGKISYAPYEIITLKCRLA